MTIALLAPLITILIVLAVLFGVEYHCHWSFTNDRVREKGLNLKKASLVEFLQLLRKRDLVALTPSLFVCKSWDQTHISEWIAQLDKDIYRFGPLDFFCYRVFLMSAEMKAVPKYRRGSA